MEKGDFLRMSVTMNENAQTATLAPAVEKPVNAARQEAKPRWKGSQFIVKQLEAWGVRRIYGVIGDANLELLDELARQRTIQYIACRHECSAALMASAEAKLTGRPGVCLTTSGPGLANLLNGLGDAASDRAGVLAISGQVDTFLLGTHAKQYIDQQTLVRPLAASTALAAHPDALPYLLQDALLQADLDGIVAHLSIPKDLYAQTVNGTILAPGGHLRQPLHAPETVIAQTAERLKQAERPAILIGRGAYSASEAVRSLAERLTAAVATTLPAKSLFPNEHPLYAGGFGQAGSEAASRLLGESDLILVLGATWWPEKFAPDRVPVIQIDRSAANIGDGKPVELGVVGDLADIAPRLVSHLEGMRKDRKSWAARIEQVTAEWKRTIEREASADGSPLPPQRVIRAINDHMAEDAVIAVDTGDHTLWFNRIFQAKRHQILVSGRWRTLGFALPAAIAAKLVDPKRQVVAVAGDGGAVQTLLEFSTAVQHGISLLYVILNNGCYAMEKNRMTAAGWIPHGSELHNPDFAAIAEACGGRGWRAETAAELEQALQQAKSEKVPVLIDVKTASDPVPHTSI
jgi:pyruvate dehydrogenase (quinone)/pyruvate oxidase